MDSFWTNVKIFLDKCQISKHRSRKKLRTREEEQAAHQCSPTVYSDQPKVFAQRTSSNRLAPRGGSRTAAQAAARHNNEITKGGVYND